MLRWELQEGKLEGLALTAYCSSANRLHFLRLHLFLFAWPSHRCITVQKVRTAPTGQHLLLVKHFQPWLCSSLGQYVPFTLSTLNSIGRHGYCYVISHCTYFMKEVGVASLVIESWAHTAAASPLAA